MPGAQVAPRGALRAAVAFVAIDEHTRHCHIAISQTQIVTVTKSASDIGDKKCHSDKKCLRYRYEPNPGPAGQRRTQ